MAPPKKPPTPEEFEALKAKILADPNTKKIAESLKMPFDEYVAMVLKFAANPNLDPTVTIVPDEELRAAGIDPPQLKDVKAFFDERVEAMEISTKSKFADPKSQRERVTGQAPAVIPTEPAATAKPDEVRSDLKADLERERTSGKFKKF